MPSHGSQSVLSPPARRQEIACIFARAFIRLHRDNQIRAFIPESGTEPPDSLELSRETRLSVSDDTRGFTPQDGGDNA